MLHYALNTNIFFLYLNPEKRLEELINRNVDKILPDFLIVKTASIIETGFSNNELYAYMAEKSALVNYQTLNILL